MLSTLDDQWAVWLQVRALRWGESRGQRGERDVSRDPPSGTEAGEEYDLEPAASPDQKASAVGTLVTSDTPRAPLHLEEEAQGGLGPRGVASAGAKDQAAVPGVPGEAAKGVLEPGECGDSLGRPQPRRREGQPAAQEGKATVPPRVGTKPDGRGDMAGPPLVEAPPGQEGDYGAREAAGRKGEEWGRCGDQQAISGGQPPAAGRRTTSEPPNPRRQRNKPGRPGGERSQEQRVRRAKGPTARPAGAGPVGCPAGGDRPGAQRELRKRRSVCLRRTALQPLACPRPPFRAPDLQRGTGQGGQRKDQGGSSRRTLHTAAGMGNPLPSDSMQTEAVDNEDGMWGILAQ